MPPLSQTELLTLGLVTVGILAILWKRFGKKSQSLSVAQLRELKGKGALVLDVRRPAEFAAGHNKGSKNIPLDALPERLGELKAGSVILACCASGMRSGAARRLLIKAGFTEVHNAGPWQTLKD